MVDLGVVVTLVKMPVRLQDSTHNTTGKMTIIVFCLLEYDRRGDLRRFSTLMKRHKHTLELNDLRVHMEDCRLLVYRQVLKKM